MLKDTEIQKRRRQISQTRQRIKTRRDNYKKAQERIDKARPKVKRDTKRELFGGGLRGRNVRRWKRGMRNRLKGYERGLTTEKKQFEGQVKNYQDYADKQLGYLKSLEAWKRGRALKLKGIAPFGLSKWERKGYRSTGYMSPEMQEAVNESYKKLLEQHNNTTGNWKEIKNFNLNIPNFKNVNQTGNITGNATGNQSNFSIKTTSGKSVPTSSIKSYMLVRRPRQTGNIRSPFPDELPKLNTLKLPKKTKFSFKDFNRIQR